MADKFGDGEVKASDLMKVYDEVGEDFLSVGNFGERSETSRLRSAINGHRDASYACYQIVFTREVQGSKRHRLKKL